jgi:hypothetical protein
LAVRQRTSHKKREAEIGHRHMTIFIEQHITWFWIAMDDSLTVA